MQDKFINSGYLESEPGIRDLQLYTEPLDSASGAGGL